MSRILVIPAAGLGSRLGAAVPKLFVPVAGAITTISTWPMCTVGSGTAEAPPKIGGLADTQQCDEERSDQED